MLDKTNKYFTLLESWIFKALLNKLIEVLNYSLLIEKNI